MKTPFFFNPTDSGFIADPYPTLAYLRQHDPIHWSPLGFWFITAYEDVKTLLSHDKFEHDQQRRQVKKYGPKAMEHGSIRYIANSILLQNPPKHTQLRRIMAPFFTQKSLENRLDRLNSVIDNAFQKLISKSDSSQVSFDFISDLAQPVLGHIICDILGIPDSDRTPFVGKTCLSPRTLDPAPMPPSVRAELNASVDRLTPYFKHLFNNKRQHPENDLISAMTAYLDTSEKEAVLKPDPNPLTETDLIDNCLFLFAAGQEVTKSFMGNALIDLYAHQKQWQQLVKYPLLSNTALNELARYSTALQMTHRIVAESFSFKGRTFEKGHPVLLSLASANRDPAANENPDQLDLNRPSVQHLAFGRGYHYCIGAHLGLFETRHIFESMFKRFLHPTQPLVLVENSVSWQPTITIRGPESLKLSGFYNTDKHPEPSSNLDHTGVLQV